MVVWCKEGTVPDHVVCAEMPRSDSEEGIISSSRAQVKTLQYHKCRKNRCIKESYGKKAPLCKFGFPNKILSKETLNKAKNRYLPRRRCDEDRCVVPYNPETLLLWGAHMNIQKVTTSGWEMYLAKYVAKAEPSFSVPLAKDASEPEKYIRTRIVGRLEVDHINLGHHLSSSSREVIHLPTEFDPDYGYLKRKNHLPADPNSTDVFYDSILQKYMDRSPELEDVLYSDWAANYMITQRSYPVDNTNSDIEKEPEEEKDTNKRKR